MSVDPKDYSDTREVPKYTLAEVALYLRIKQSTLRDWFFDRNRLIRGVSVLYRRLAEPALHNPYGPTLSFYNLAEAHVLCATRQKWVKAESFSARVHRSPQPQFGTRVINRPQSSGISMQAVRRALEYVSAKYPSPHPLISHQFYTNGKQIFIKLLEEEVGEQLVVNLSKFGQLGFSAILEAYLQRIDRDSFGLPLKIYPLRSVQDDDRSIVIVSGVASGRPTIAGTGIRAEVVWHRAKAGESVEELSDDYGIEPRVIEKAISYFTDLKAA